jgi:hypothetical protein
METSDMRPYRMTVTLSVIDHLGLNLYSNIPAVLAEAVANAWDADATLVEVDLGEHEIRIADNGMGMTMAEINDKFLTVGYRRRETEPVVTVRGRHVMGRKGIGKLSLFSIARIIEVRTAKRANGELSRNGLVLRTSSIREAARNNETYYPEPISHARPTVEPGTEIRLEDLSIHPTAGTRTALRRRLARRFSIIGDDFTIVVDGTPIALSERAYFEKVQYLWSIGDVGHQYVTLAKNADRSLAIDGTIDADAGYKVRGWVGTLDDRRSIDEGANSVPVLAWGKLLHEDLLADIRAGGLFTKYLTGELHADFVDLDQGEDIVTSDRQSLKEDDPRVRSLTDWFRRTVLREVERSWRDWRRDTALENALELEPIKLWYEGLSVDEKHAAKQLFGKIGTLALEDERARRELYRYAILAFEKLRFQSSLSRIEELPEDPDFDTIRAVFGGIDDLEAAQYHQIARGRLEVIRAFTRIVESERERVIQSYLFDHLWLLHPSWERASTNARVEEQVAKEFGKVDAQLTEDEKRARVDIRYRTAAGKHLIIELKKYDATVNVYELARQVAKYRRALEKVLRRFPEEAQHIEAIVVVGHPPSGDNPSVVEGVLREAGARYVTYDQLIADTLNSYEDYIAADREVSRISAILDSLEPENDRLG